MTLVAALSTIGRRTAIVTASLHVVIGVIIALPITPAFDEDELESWIEFRELFPTFAGLFEVNQRIAGVSCAALASVVLFVYVGNKTPAMRDWLASSALMAAFVAIAIVDDAEDAVVWLALAAFYALSQGAVLNGMIRSGRVSEVLDK